MRRWIASMVGLGLAAVLAVQCVPPPSGVTSGGQAGADEPVAAPGPGGASSVPAVFEGDVTTDLASVESVDILILESMPVQVQVRAIGNLPDGCTSIDQAVVTQTGNEFKVTLTTQRPADAMCTQVLVPFEHTVPLDVVGLKAGQYAVTVNGVSATFELAVDNVLQ